MLPIHGKADGFLEPGRLSSLAVFLVVAVALVGVVLEYPSAFRSASKEARFNEGQPYYDRLERGGLALDVDRTFLLHADSYLGARDTYAVAVGPDVVVSTPLTRQVVPGYAQSYLLPRRQVALGEHPKWLLCYGCSASDREKAQPVWESGGYMMIGRLR